jgi:hypothetical protein
MSCWLMRRKDRIIRIIDKLRNEAVIGIGIANVVFSVENGSSPNLVKFG